ncbi:MAG: (d)CMP kinase [Oscillospiraceae bacterium]|nr:(d)CMP kinase [Oscillospiraceae bacterium]MCL1952020.1 (d)CMP kinase [Oscillospiraceae bacterium]
MIVAIDGPAGAGKSTVARGAARALGYTYIDTGALYRGIGVSVMRLGVDTKDKEAVAACLPVPIDATEAIRTPEASMAASDVGAVPAVRAYLLEVQRDMARRADNCILDGRDIGTVVLPNADVKVFLTARPGERARRRWEEQKAKGVADPYEKVLAEVLARDEQDSSRAAAPLRPAEDSILLDTTDMGLDESIQALLTIIESKRNRV